MSHSSAIKTQIYRKAPCLKYFGFLWRGVFWCDFNLFLIDLASTGAGASLIWPKYLSALPLAAILEASKKVNWYKPASNNQTHNQ